MRAATTLVIAAAAAASRQYVAGGGGGGWLPRPSRAPYYPRPVGTATPRETPVSCWAATGSGTTARRCCWLRTPCGERCTLSRVAAAGDAAPPARQCWPQLCGGRLVCEPAGTPTPAPTGGYVTPTAAPTASPAPSVAPTASSAPTAAPTASPAPTAAPTASPAPTVAPTPTMAPTMAPTASPTPTMAPTASPTPTAAPTASPTPTAAPTASPTPSAAPWTFGDGWGRCTAANARVRKEIRDLTAAERSAWTAAHRAFIDSGAFDVFVTVHRVNAAAAHGGPGFLPWHRYFLIELEDALRAIDPTVVLPYWDWSLDRADPAVSPAWATTLLGGATPGGCIPDGPFANVSATQPVRCVRRGFTARTANGMAGIQFEEPAVIAQLVSPATAFPAFADAWEFAHGAPHVAIGGAALASDFGQMFFVSRSPSDPAFFLHHAYVDKVWADRQAANDPTDYAGTQNGEPVAATDIMPPFGRPVSAAFSVPCVSYQQPSTRPPPASTTRRRTSRATAERVVAAEGAAKLDAMARFAAANGVSQESIDESRALLFEADVAATIEGRTSASVVAAADAEAAA